jgi:flagellar biosynthesis protein FlhF
MNETRNKFQSIEKKEERLSKTTSATGSNTDMFKEIKTEISQLNDKIKLIQNMFWNEKSPADLTTTIPPEFSEIYRIAKQSGMKREHLEMIMKLSIQHMPFKMRHNSETIRRYFKVVLRKMIPTRAETLVQPPNKKIVMLVGPTGVGKTTTIAKLTARFALKSQRNYKVGLIVLDSYKIGAVEQLSQYARMMKVNIETVISSDEFMEKLERMSSYDYIFIDTMGSSPYDAKKIEQTQDFLNSNHLQHNIDVMLVVPSSLKYEDLKQTYDSFSRLNIDTIMFTKLDETKGFGNIFSLVHEIQKPISYFSIGQEVPEDIVVATSDYLVESLLNGFKRERDE